MLLIERYIFGKAGIASLITLGSLVGVVWIVQVLKQIDIINDKGQSISAFLKITSLAVPNLVLAVIPVTLFLSTMHTINSMNANSELVVVTASGSSNWTLAKPMLTLALLCSLFAGMAGHFISPITLQKLKEYVTEMRADLVSVIVQEGSFNLIENGLTFHIAKREAGGVLSGILISDDRDKNISMIYSAQHGIVSRDGDKSLLKLKDGEIQQTNRKDGRVTLIKYQSYIFDLSNFSADKPKTSRRAKERLTHELFNPDPNDEYYQKNPGRFRSQIHERFSEMLWPFAYVLIILAFAGQTRSNRQSFSAAITAACVAVVVARGLGFSAVNVLKTNPDAVYYVYALPLICIIFGSYFVFTNQTATLPKRVIDQIDRNNTYIANRYESFIQSYRAYQRKRAGIKS